MLKKLFKNQRGDMNVWTVIILPLVIVLSTLLYNSQTRATSYEKSAQLALDGTALYLATFSNRLDMIIDNEEVEVVVLDYVHISGNPNIETDYGIYREIFISMLENSNVVRAMYKYHNLETVNELISNEHIIIYRPKYDDNYLSMTMEVDFELPPNKLWGKEGDVVRIKSTVRARGGF